jgi:orotate phosphoribosyltransferase-like protein
MREPDEVSAMLTLHEKGWGTRRIARELGVSRNTVKRWLAEGGWVAYRRPERVARLGGWRGCSRSASSVTAVTPR